MIRTIRYQSLRKFKPQNITTFATRFNSQKVNFHRPDIAGSDEPAEAADAAATILAELRDKQINPNKVTWIDALKEREKLRAEGKTIDSFSYVDPKTTVVGEKLVVIHFLSYYYLLKMINGYVMLISMLLVD